MVEVSVRDLLNEFMTEDRNIREQIRELKAKLKAKREVISEIASRVGQDVSFPPIDEEDEQVISKKGILEIKPDTFFGMSHPNAAAKYLEMIGHAVHIDEILDALRRGGAKFEGKDPKTSLYTQLVRGTRRFVKVGDESVFGLLKFYPDMKKRNQEMKGKTADEIEMAEESENENKEK